MALPKEKEIEHYTYADLCTWDDDTVWELIDGVAYAMATPSLLHQGISVELSRQLSNFLEDKPCKVYAAPGVRLNADTSDDTYLIPDVVVVCDRSKLSQNTVDGAPDLVIEILSPSTGRFDTLKKFQQYQKAGVREYWIVNPELKVLSAHILENGKYTVSVYGDEDKAPVYVLEGCEINLERVFAE